MIYIFLADGFEEVEAVTPIDILRRAGVEVKSVGVGSKNVRGAHNIYIEADLTESEIRTDSIDGVILPGGMPGTLNLDASETVKKTVLDCFNSGKLVAAICAAPSVLGGLGILKDKTAICYPGFEKKMNCKTVSEKSVVTDGNVITGKGPGVAAEFALEIVKYLADKKTSDDIKASMQMNR